MRIVTPTEIERVAWAGYLEPLGQTFRIADLPRLTLGEPTIWPPEALESETGKKWSPPASDRRYALLRLACTLHKPDDPRTRYTEATLAADLHPLQGAGSVIAHDLYPQRVTATSSSKSVLALKPDFQFYDVGLSLGEVGVEIEHHNAFPVIQAFGLGESRPYWQFARHEASPLLGCQSVYVVLAAPKDSGVRLEIELTVRMETRYGPIRVGLPDEVRARVYVVS